MNEITCVFTKQLQPESYSHVTDDEVLDELERVIERFLSNCPDATLVSITTREMRTTDVITPQPFITANVSVTGDPQESLIISNVSIVGDIDHYSEDVFPVELLGPRYWVVDEDVDIQDPIDRAGTSKDGIVNTIVTLLDEYVNGRND